MITVDEFMTAEPITLSADDSLSDARKIMTESNIRHIPVTDNEKQLLGLVSQRDVLAATDPKSEQQTRSSPCEGDADIKLSDIMIHDVSTLLKTDSLRQAAMYLQSHKYGCLPVVHENCLVGIITDSDFIDIAINLLEQVEIVEDDDADVETVVNYDDTELSEIESDLVE